MSYNHVVLDNTEFGILSCYKVHNQSK